MFPESCQSSFESHFIITTITTTTTATIVPYCDLLCLLTLSNLCVCLLIPCRHLVTVFMDIIMNIFLWFVPYALVAVISFAVTTMGWSVVDGLVSPSTGQVNSSTPRARRSPQYLPDMESSNQSKDNSTVGQMAYLIDLFSSGADDIIGSLAKFNLRALETITDIANPSVSSRVLQMVIICLMVALTGITVAITML